MYKNCRECDSVDIIYHYQISIAGINYTCFVFLDSLLLWVHGLTSNILQTIINYLITDMDLISHTLHTLYPLKCCRKMRHVLFCQTKLISNTPYTHTHIHRPMIYIPEIGYSNKTGWTLTWFAQKSLVYELTNDTYTLAATVVGYSLLSNCVLAANG